MRMTSAALDEILAGARAELFSCFDECDAAATAYVTARKTAGTVHLCLAYARAAGRMMEACARIYRALDHAYGRPVNHFYLGSGRRNGRVYCQLKIEPRRCSARPQASAASLAAEEEFKPPSQNRRSIPDGAEPARSGLGASAARKRHDKPLEKIDEQFAPPSRRRPGAPCGNRNALKTGLRGAEIRALRAQVRALCRRAKSAVTLFNALRGASANPAYAALLAAGARARSETIAQAPSVQESRPARSEPSWAAVNAAPRRTRLVAPRRAGRALLLPAGRRNSGRARLDAARRPLFCPHPAARAGPSDARPLPRPSHAASHR